MQRVGNEFKAPLRSCLVIANQSFLSAIKMKIQKYNYFRTL